MALQGTFIDLSRETVENVRRLVSQELSSSGVRDNDVTVQPGEDHDGEPAIMVRVKHRRNFEHFDARLAAEAVFKLNSMLRQRGEHRFAYIKHDEEADA